MSVLRVRHSTKKYATGKRAYGQCQRCGLRYMLSDLAEDPNTLMLVCDDCRDPLPPEDVVHIVSDAQALRRPSPDQDDPGGNTITDIVDDEATTFPAIGNRS